MTSGVSCISEIEGHIVIGDATGEISQFKMLEKLELIKNFGKICPKKITGIAGDQKVLYIVDEAGNMKFIQKTSQ